MRAESFEMGDTVEHKTSKERGIIVNWSCGPTGYQYQVDCALATQPRWVDACVLSKVDSTAPIPGFNPAPEK